MTISTKNVVRSHHHILLKKEAEDATSNSSHDGTLDEHNNNNGALYESSSIQEDSEKPRFMEAMTPRTKLQEEEHDGENDNTEGGKNNISSTLGVADTRNNVPFVDAQHLKAKLYSRTKEESELLQNFQMLRRNATAELVLITGPSGSGKTTLAKTLKAPVHGMGGYFLAGKYDQLQRPYPYIGFVAAFSTFAKLCVERGEGAVLRMRRAIKDAVGDEAAVLTGMIPALEVIIGSSYGDEPKSKTTTSDAIPRFVFVFRKFIKAVCSADSPLVLLLEDVHWADPCSLDVMGSILVDNEVEGLVLIATCDDNIPAESYLSSKLRELEDKRNAVITQVTLNNLGEEAVRDVLSDVLQLDRESSASLSKIVLQQSGGNPAFLVDFLRWLQDSNLLYLDRCSGSWRWSENDIGLMIDIDRVGSFLVDKLEQLPVQIRDVLKVSSCLGPHLDEQLLEYVLGVSVEATLSEAALRSVITFDETIGGYIFEHDKIQRAAYGLIEKNERELFHLEVGRRMWRRLNSDEELDRHLFTLLSQIHIGWRLITREKEQVAVATLCLRAGTKAARSSAFRTALTYLELGISLLGPRSWRDNYELTLVLYNATAEMAVCRANFERMDELVEIVLTQAKSLTDKSQAYATRIYALGVSEKQAEAIATAEEVLKGLGEALKKPGNFRIIREFRLVQKKIGRKSDDQLLRMPKMIDKEKLACMQILYLVFLRTLFSRDHQNLMPLIVLKMVRLTIEHGSSVFASAAFSYYGIVCIMTCSKVDCALRFGALGVKFLELFQAKEFLPRVYAAYYGFIHPWKAPLKESLEPLLHGHKVGLQTGDMEGAFICSNLYCLTAVESEKNLCEIDREWSIFQEAMISTRHKTLLSYSMPKVQMLHHQMGLTKDPLSAKGDILDYDVVLKLAKDSGNDARALVARVSRMSLSYTFGDLYTAEKMASELKYLERVPLCIMKIFTTFFRGLVVLACAREGRKVRKHLRTARKVIKELERCATMSPHNCLDKLFLLQAEYASVLKRPEAYSKYACALAMAKDSGFSFTAALANEQMARHFLCIGGERDVVLSYFNEACRYYKEWGGAAKLDRLEAEILTLYTG